MYIHPIVEKLLYQARAGRDSDRFPEIALSYVYLEVCMRACVCLPSPRPLITSGAVWILCDW